MERKTRAAYQSDKKGNEDRNGEGEQSNVSPDPINNKLQLIINKLDNVELDIKAIKNDQASLIASNELCNSSIVEINSKIQTQDNSLKTCIGDVNEWQEENKQLKIEINNVNDVCKDLQQYTRKNCIDDIGIPHRDNENLLLIIEKISSLIGFTFNATMVSNCHRLHN